LLLPHVLERVGQLVSDLVAYYSRDANATRFGQCLQPRRHIDTITEDVAVFRDHVAEVDPDAEPDPALF
jgi:hypothetical protein